MKQYNKKILNASCKIFKKDGCNWWHDDNCPLDNKYLSDCLVYIDFANPNKLSSTNYLQLNENSFRDHCNKHKSSPSMKNTKTTRNCPDTHRFYKIEMTPTSFLGELLTTPFPLVPSQRAATFAFYRSFILLHLMIRAYETNNCS